MCAKYETPETRALERIWEIRRSNGMEDVVKTAFPGLVAPFAKLEDGVPVWTAGQFGILPHWCKPENAKKLTRSTYNARTETVFEKPSFKTAWTKRSFCLVPAAAIHEPNYESGKPVSWRIERTDGQPILIAGICWNWKNTATGEYRESFSMLTINADEHPLMRRFHKPEDEKRMVVMVPDALKSEWLNAPSHDAARVFFSQYPAELLTAGEG